VHSNAPRRVQPRRSRIIDPGWIALSVCLALGAGCRDKAGSGSSEGVQVTDPLVASNLANLSHELRKAMPRYKLTRNFDEFVTITHVEVPPPPAGQKYAISKEWKVILVDSK
jgi:hypothetical protein